MNPQELPASADRLLFTPGPLTTSLAVKQAMLHDAGSWHFEFNELVAALRDRVLDIAKVSRAKGYECVFMQGSGTFGVEAVLASMIPREGAGKVLIAANGAYGDRMVLMAQALGVPHRVLKRAEDQVIEPEVIRAELAGDAELTHVALVHCETTTGILNPIHDIGQVVREAGRDYIVDAMSSFAALPIDLDRGAIDILISSPNKCLEGVPGFSFVIAERSKLKAARGVARSLSLDIVGQWDNFEKKGQFRFTPPTHAILAFAQALDEFDQEGGTEARGARYRRNHAVLMQGMAALGFRPFLASDVQSPIITSFHYPDHPNFQFDPFYRRLSERGMVIYPGKLTEIECFRIGSIGRIFEKDVRQLLGAIADTLDLMEIRLNDPDAGASTAPVKQLKS